MDAWGPPWHAGRHHGGETWITDDVGFLPRKKGNHGFCRIKGCTLQEDVYRDGVPLTRVLSRSKLVSGAFYASYSRNTMWLLDDPTGHVIEQATASAIVESETSDDVTVQGFTIEGAANAAQHGAIHAEGATGWDIAENEVRDNHGTGIIAAPFAPAANNRFVHDTYHLPSLADGFFAWNDDDLTPAQWVAAGQDTNGTFSSP